MWSFVPNVAYKPTGRFRIFSSDMFFFSFFFLFLFLICFCFIRWNSLERTLCLFLFSFSFSWCSWINSRCPVLQLVYFNRWISFNLRDPIEEFYDECKMWLGLLLLFFLLFLKFNWITEFTCSARALFSLRLF